MSQSIVVKGKVIHNGETEKIGTGDFTKRLLVVETDEQYPQQLPIEFVKDKTKLLDAIAVGQEVEVSINLRGRKWTNEEGVDKYFPSFQGWRITPATAGDTNSTAPAEEKEEDDLPF